MPVSALLIKQIKDHQMTFWVILAHSSKLHYGYIYGTTRSRQELLMIDLNRHGDLQVVSSRSSGAIEMLYTIFSKPLAAALMAAAGLFPIAGMAATAEEQASTVIEAGQLPEMEVVPESPTVTYP
ncbi:hypothetical protein [Streptomyces sp. NPDC051909]|uniref:hypothetical protein n=1 Tax=Streptomyces sp. NPDC051909 TaxID=3154944 RepID=UPI00343B7943